MATEVFENNCIMSSVTIEVCKTLVGSIGLFRGQLKIHVKLLSCMMGSGWTKLQVDAGFSAVPKLCICRVRYF